MKLVIEQCGPLKDCEFSIKRFNLLFGYGGKSIILKNTWFFCNIDDMYVASKSKGLSDKGFTDFLSNCYLTYLGELLLGGSKLSVKFYYNSDDYITVVSDDNQNLVVKLSETLIDRYNQSAHQLNLIPWKVLYVPSERDLAYYDIKFINDNFIADFIEYYKNTLVKDFSKGIVYNEEVFQLINMILDQPYRITSQLEYLGALPTTHLSTSMKKSLALINVLIHQLNCCKQSSFILIDDPESNQYPLMQMFLTQLILLTYSKDNNVFISSNSPYVLGTISVAMEADLVKDKQKLSTIIPEYFTLSCKDLSACYIDSCGAMKSGIADGYLANELMDDASDVINCIYDMLIDLK